MMSSDRLAVLRNTKSYNELVVDLVSNYFSALLWHYKKLPKNIFLFVTLGYISNLKFPIMNDCSKIVVKY